MHITAEKSREKQKCNYNLKARATKLLIGERVLVKILAHDGKHKLSDKWTEEWPTQQWKTDKNMEKEWIEHFIEITFRI